MSSDNKLVKTLTTAATLTGFVAVMGHPERLAKKTSAPTLP